MQQWLSVPLRLLIALLALLALAPVAMSAQSQPSSGTAQISIDSPTEGATLPQGGSIIIGGWAADVAGPGTGVDAVRIYLNGQMDHGGTLLGDASYGFPRPDVAAALGSAAYTNSGFDFTWSPTGLNSGTHTLYVYAHSVGGAWSYKTVTVTAPAQPTGTPAPAGTPVAAPPRGQPSLPNDFRGGFDAGMPCLPPRGPGGPPCLPPPGPPMQQGFGRPNPGGAPIVPIKSPGSLTVIDVTPNSVQMGWSIVSGAVGYRVFMAIAGDSSAPVPVSDHSATGATVYNLQPDTTYTFQVVAIDASGNQSPPSRPLTVTTDPLPASRD